MIERGLLGCLGAWETSDGRERRRVDPETVIALLPDDGSFKLRRLTIGAILAGRFVVPPVAERWGLPAPLSAAVDFLTNGFRPRVVLPPQVIEHNGAETFPTPG